MFLQKIFQKNIRPYLRPFILINRTKTTDTFFIPDDSCKPNVPHLQRLNRTPKPTFGGRNIVTMLVGIGNGPELMDCVQKVFTFAQVPVVFDVVEFDHPTNCGKNLNHAILSIKRNHFAIKSSVDVQCDEEIFANTQLRNVLDLFVSVVHCRSIRGVTTAKYCDIDVVVVRQNSEGEFHMWEHQPAPGVIESSKVITRKTTERVARYTFEFARNHARQTVTAIHKADVLEKTDGLFLETARRVSLEYPDIQFNDMSLERCARRLITSPQQFDVILLTSLYGTIICNILCGLIGGPGIVPLRMCSNQYAVFEPAISLEDADIVGTPDLNPIAILNASVDLLEHLGYQQHAYVIERAIEKTICMDKVQTPDMGGCSSTSDVIECIQKNILEYRQRDNLNNI